MGMTERLDLEAVKARHEIAQTGRDKAEAQDDMPTFTQWVWDHASAAHADRAALISEVEALREALKTVRAYAKLGMMVSEEWPDYAEIDGGDLFEMLEESGVIEKHPEPYDPDKHGTVEDCEPGDDFYRRAVPIARARAVLPETEVEK
jgi:hypothetical protein